jgi:hypothetical protein
MKPALRDKWVELVREIVLLTGLDEPPEVDGESLD